MNHNSSYPGVPFPILRKLGLLRQRKFWMHSASALVASITVLLLAMGLAMLIDWLATLYDSRWRFVLTAAAIAAAVLTCATWLVVAARSLLRLERIAVEVDREIPQLAERWTTMTRLGKDADDAQVIHPAMLRRLSAEAASWEPHVAPEQIISNSTLMRTMIGLTAITAILAIAVVMDSQRTLVLLKRFWLPGASISATQLVNLPGDIVVGRGEPLALAAELRGISVERALLFMRSKSDAGRQVSLVAQGQSPIAFSHRLRAVEEPFDYRFRAGDGQTDWYTVRVAERPEIEKVRLIVTPPPYTRQPPKSFDRLPARVSTLEKSELELALRPKSNVKSVELRFGEERKTRLAVDADGWFRWKTTLAESFTITPVLFESHGLTNFRPPKCQISVYPDKPPTVKVLTPDDQLAVRPDDTVQITFSASDDVGIGLAELLVYDELAPTIPGEEPLPITVIPIPLGEQAGARSIQETVNLDLSQFVVNDGTELSYEVRVREDRGETPTESLQQSIAGQATLRAPSPGASTSSQPPPNHVADLEAGTPSSAELSDSANSKSHATLRAPSNISRNEAPVSKATEPDTPSNRQIASTDGQSVRPTTEKPPNKSSKPLGPMIDQIDKEKIPKQIADGTPAKTLPAANQLASKSATESDSHNRKQAPQPNSDAASSSVTGKESNPSSGEEASSEVSTARSASSGRQALTSGRSEAPTESMAPASETKNANKSGNPSANPRRQTSGQQLPQRGNQTDSNNEQQRPASPSDRSPGDSMPRRFLDIAQSTSSQRMRLKIDEWAGSFEGQQRAKLEMAVSPILEALDKALEKAQKTARGALDESEASKKWRASHDREVTSAERSTVSAQELVRKLHTRTNNTPYAFIGLQIADIGLAHIEPARMNFWKALESEGDDRVTSVRDAWQHLGRARQLIAELRGQYERTRREFQLAESMERVKKMYRVYLENSQALLQTQDSDPTRYNRKMAQFELDDEYLKRLKEVLEMRRDLQAELARILAEDPRLLRRFMDSMRNRTNSLREELAGIVADQADLNREVRAWTLVDELDRPKIAKILMLKQVQDASKIATAAGKLQSRYQTWLPLDRESKDTEMAAATQAVQKMASAASELNAAAQKFIAESQRAAVKSETPSSATSGSSAPTPPEAASSLLDAETQAAIDGMLSDAKSLYDCLNELEVNLRQLAAREEGAEAALFAANRLVDTRRLVADSSAWVRQMRAHKHGNYNGAAEVDQYRLAMKTEQLAGKLGSIEQALANAMQRSDGTLPESIAEKAREFSTTLDRQVSPSQLASVYALHSNQLPRATQRQKAASEALASAERTYDELMRLVIEEMDKLPVQDPVSDLLDDPTLDELLAQLEQELPIQELLGIPPRPSNLQIIGDWLRPGGGGGSSGGGGAAQMAANQLQQDHQRAQQRLNLAYQRAIARALKESRPVRVEVPRTVKLSDWNRLVSKLDEDVGQGRDKAPPEPYRRAIEQYFSQISRAVAEGEQASP